MIFGILKILLIGLWGNERIINLINKINMKTEIKKELSLLNTLELIELSSKLKNDKFFRKIFLILTNYNEKLVKEIEFMPTYVFWVMNFENIQFTP